MSHSSSMCTPFWRRGDAQFADCTLLIALIAHCAFANALFGVVAAPDPHQGIGQGLLEHAAIAVPGRATEDIAVVVALGFERSRGSLSGHDPVVITLFGILRPVIIF